MATLSSIVERLNTFAPLTLAESWDNVGLLIEPSNPRLVLFVFVEINPKSLMI